MCRSLGSPSGLRPSGDPRDLHIRSTLIRNLSHALTGDNLYILYQCAWVYYRAYGAWGVRQKCVHTTRPRLSTLKLAPSKLIFVSKQDSVKSTKIDCLKTKIESKTKEQDEKDVQWVWDKSEKAGRAELWERIIRRDDQKVCKPGIERREERTTRRAWEQTEDNLGK